MFDKLATFLKVLLFFSLPYYKSFYPPEFFSPKILPHQRRHARPKQAGNTARTLYISQRFSHLYNNGPSVSLLPSSIILFYSTNTGNEKNPEKNANTTTHTPSSTLTQHPNHQTVKWNDTQHTHHSRTSRIRKDIQWRYKQMEADGVLVRDWTTTSNQSLRSNECIPRGLALTCLVLLLEEGISWRKKRRRGSFVTSLRGVFLLARLWFLPGCDNGLTLKWKEHLGWNGVFLGKMFRETAFRFDFITL